MSSRRAEGGGHSHDRELTEIERRELSDQLDWPSIAHQTEVTGGHVFHLSLTADPGDRPLGDEEWVSIVGRVVRDLGVDDPKLVALVGSLLNTGRTGQALNIFMW